jgi:hypothetical protein
MEEDELYDLSSTFPTPRAITDYDGDGVVSTKDIVIYIVITVICAVIAAYLK